MRDLGGLVVIFEGFGAFFDRQGGDGQPATRPPLSPAQLDQAMTTWPPSKH